MAANVTNPLNLGAENPCLKNCFRCYAARPLMDSGTYKTEDIFDVMKAMRVTSGPSRTLWTSVMDLNERTLEVHYFKEFERKYEFTF